MAIVDKHLGTGRNGTTDAIVYFTPESYIQQNTEHCLDKKYRNCFSHSCYSFLTTASCTKGRLLHFTPLNLDPELTIKVLSQSRLLSISTHLLSIKHNSAHFAHFCPVLDVPVLHCIAQFCTLYHNFSAFNTGFILTVDIFSRFELISHCYLKQM